MNRIFACTIALCLAACAGPDLIDQRGSPAIEVLRDFDYIYVLGPYDIPDGQDSDGVQDRPRLLLWDRDGIVELKETEMKRYGEAQMEVMAMLDSRYTTVDSFTWHHNFHHIDNTQQGGIALPDDTIVGWLYRSGGLGYFDFDYDPVVEKVSWFTPKPEIEQPRSSIGRLYRVRSRTGD